MHPLTRSRLFLLPLRRLFLPFLLGPPLPSPWSPPSPCSSSDFPLSRQGAALAHLNSLSPLAIWCFELTALFLFLLVNAALPYLPTAFFVAQRPHFPFQQAQYAQASVLKPAPFCNSLAGLGSTNKSAISLLPFDSRSVLTTLSSPSSFFLPRSLWQELSFLLFHQTTMGPRTPVSPGEQRG